MAQGIEIASTTDSQADIERAIGLDPSAEALKEEQAQAAPGPEQHSEEQEILKERTENGQGKSKLEKRIGRLTADKYAAVRRAEQAEREAADLRAELERVTVNGHIESGQAEPQPEPERSEPERVAPAQPGPTNGNGKIPSAKDFYADWNQVFSEAQQFEKETGWKLPAQFFEQLKASPYASHLAYRIYKNPQLTRELAKVRTNPQLGSAIISSLESQIAGELEMAQYPKAHQHAARIEGVLRDAPDVVEKMRKGSLSPIPQSVTREIYAYDNAPEMLVYLGRYEEERQALSRMSSQAAADAVRELSETLSAHTVRGNGRPANHAPATSRPVSAAPAPIPALRGTASASTLDPDEMDFQDFKAWREKNKRTYGVRR